MRREIAQGQLPPGVPGPHALEPRGPLHRGSRTPTYRRPGGAMPPATGEDLTGPPGTEVPFRPCSAGLTYGEAEPVSDEDLAGHPEWRFRSRHGRPRAQHGGSRGLRDSPGPRKPSGSGLSEHAKVPFLPLRGRESNAAGRNRVLNEYAVGSAQAGSRSVEARPEVPCPNTHRVPAASSACAMRTRRMPRGARRSVSHHACPWYR